MYGFKFVAICRALTFVFLLCVFYIRRLFEKCNFIILMLLVKSLSNHNFMRFERYNLILKLIKGNVWHFR